MSNMVSVFRYGQIHFGIEVHVNLHEQSGDFELNYEA